MPDHFGDKYKAEESLGMNIHHPFHPIPIKQQPNVKARKLPDRSGKGNDMDGHPNATDGSRDHYVSGN